MTIQRFTSHPPLAARQVRLQAQQISNVSTADPTLPYLHAWMAHSSVAATMRYFKPIYTTFERRRSFKFVPLSLGQLHQILDRSSDDPTLRDLHDVVAMVSNTGIGAGELEKLLWADVDFSARKLAIADMKSVRWVPFGPKTLQMLKSRRERHPEAEFVLGKSPRGLLRRVFLQLRKVCDGIGVPGVALNVLRRTFFVRLLSAGASVDSLSTIGGHKLVAKSFLSADRRLEMAARDQARIEEL